MKFTLFWAAVELSLLTVLTGIIEMTWDLTHGIMLASAGCIGLWITTLMAK